MQLVLHIGGWKHHRGDHNYVELLDPPGEEAVPCVEPSAPIGAWGGGERSCRDESTILEEMFRDASHLSRGLEGGPSAPEKGVPTYDDDDFDLESESDLDNDGDESGDDSLFSIGGPPPSARARLWAAPTPPAYSLSSPPTASPMNNHPNSKASGRASRARKHRSAPSRATQAPPAKKTKSAKPPQPTAMPSQPCDSAGDKWKPQSRVLSALPVSIPQPLSTTLDPRSPTCYARVSQKYSGKKPRTLERGKITHNQQGWEFATPVEMEYCRVRPPGLCLRPPCDEALGVCCMCGQGSFGLANAKTAKKAGSTPRHFACYIVTPECEIFSALQKYGAKPANGMMTLCKGCTDVLEHAVKDHYVLHRYSLSIPYPEIPPLRGFLDFLVSIGLNPKKALMHGLRLH